MRLGNPTISSGTVNKPPGICALPTAFSIYTNDCTSKDPSVKLLKYADDSTIIGLIRNHDESEHRQEVEQLAFWCGPNNVELNMLKTVQKTADFRGTPSTLASSLPYATAQCLSWKPFLFLGSIISQDLKRVININS